MRVTTKGQVTIPQEIRDFMGIKPYSEVDFRLNGNTVYLVKATHEKPRSRFSKVVGILKNGKTTDQMMEFTRN